MTPIILFAAAIILATVALALYAREIRVRILNVRVAQAINMEQQAAPITEMMGWLAALGNRYRRYYSSDNLEQLRLVVQSSGFNPHRMMPILIGSKTVCMAGFPLLAALVTQLMGSPLNDSLIIVALAAVVGIMGPRLILRFINRRFNAAVDRGTPDAIDLLVVCTEAGMGLESALERVAREMNRSNPAMNKVLTALLDDLRVLPNRRDAFVNLSARSTSEGVRRFGTMIGQSLQYGTPLTHVLRAIAEELRRERITKLEERAHKLGAKLVIPMVMFMLPAMFVILAGSPFLHLIETVRMISK